jgi:hypothetical protein
MKRIEGFKVVTALPADERIVAMIEYEKEIYFATDKGVYRMRGGEAVKIIAVSGSEGMAVGCGDEDA